MQDYLGKDIKKLGFGFMRLPKIEGVDEIDMKQVKDMVDMFLGSGGTYFDTAFGYLEGRSEVALKKALIDRYPRESFQIATKLPVWAVTEDRSIEDVHRISMERLGTDYLDFYLLHSLNKSNYPKTEDYKAWDFVSKLKKEGKVKNIGFSFHADAEYLDLILSNHPEVDFIQLQINYIDWESESIQSRKCYEVAKKHNKPVIIMEPVKGGSLATVAPSAENLFKEANPNASVPSWAIRYCASLDNIITVLSGMSTLEQMKDNLSYMKDFKPLTSDEKDVIKNVVTVLEAIPTIPCTDCKYCVEGCPTQINIPRLFTVMNNHKKFDNDPMVASNMNPFINATKENGKPSDCIACGACEALCPQHIHIIDELIGIKEVYEK